MTIKLRSWQEIILAVVIAFILAMCFFACDKVENPMAPDLDPIINPPVVPPPPPTEYTIYMVVTGEVLELLQADLHLEFEDEGILGGWSAEYTLTRTWDFGRRLEEGEYTIKLVLDRHNLVPWDLIATVPFKFSFTYWSNDENVEIIPSSDDSGWVYFLAEGDYKEFSFVVKEL